MQSTLSMFCHMIESCSIEKSDKWLQYFIDVTSMFQVSDAGLVIKAKTNDAASNTTLCALRVGKDETYEEKYFTITGVVNINAKWLEMRSAHLLDKDTGKEHNMHSYSKISMKKIERCSW